jgi:hypothetical protein
MINYDQIIADYCPLFRFHGFEKNFPCSIEHLLANSTLKTNKDIHNPTTADLAEHCGDKVYVDVAASQFPGEPLVNGTVTAPLYAAVQTTPEGLIEISYLVLYAYKNGQTVAFRAPSPKPPFETTTVFSAILHSYGEHQGDLERVGVRLIPGPDGLELFQVSFDAFGQDRWFSKNQCFMEGTHPLVHVALSGHSHHNRRVLEESLEVDKSVGSAWFISALDDGGPVWRPWITSRLIRLGLDDRGDPINGNRWAKFGGRLGKRDTHSLRSATYLEGTGLNDINWATVVAADFLNSGHHGQITDDMRIGDGPRGPAGRDWIRPTRGACFKPHEMMALWATDDNNNGCDALAWLTGDMDGDGHDELVQVWRTGQGHSGMTHFIPAGAMHGLFNVVRHDDNGQPWGDLWRIGNFYGQGRAEILQLWSNDRELAINRFSARGNGEIGFDGQQQHMREGLAAEAYLVGDFHGVGRDQLLEIWLHNNYPSFICYQSDGGDFREVIKADTTGISARDSRSWFAGRFYGQPQAQVIQAWGDGAELAISRFYAPPGRDFAFEGYQSHLGEVTSTLAWFVGDFVGNGKDQLVQVWDCQGKVAITMYQYDYNIAFHIIARNTDLGEGKTGHFQMVDVDGNGQARIVHAWTHDKKLGLTVYGFDGSNFSRLWREDELNEGAQAFNWLALKAKPGKGPGQLLQLWEHWNHHLALIGYGSIGTERRLQ